MPGLFEDVHYYLHENNVEKLNSVKAALKQGEGNRSFYLTPLVTHVISDQPVDPVNHLDCVVVHSDWVLLSVKCGVLLPTVAFEVQTKKLLSSLVFTTSKLSREVVKRIAVLVFTFGGAFQTKLDCRVTHLISSTTTGEKYKYATDHCEAVKVVTPDWLLACLDAEKIVDEGSYHPSHDASPEPEDPVRFLDATNGSSESVPNGLFHEQQHHEPNVEHPPSTTGFPGIPLTHKAEDTCFSQAPTVIQQTQQPNELSKQDVNQSNQDYCQPQLDKQSQQDFDQSEHIALSQQDSSQPEESEQPQQDSLESQPRENSQQDSTQPEQNYQTQQDSQQSQSCDNSQQDSTQSNPSESLDQTKGNLSHATAPQITKDAIVLETPVNAARAGSERQEYLKTPSRSRNEAISARAISSELNSSNSSLKLLKGMVLCLTDYNQFLDAETIATWIQVIEQHGGKVLKNYAKTRCTHVLAMHKRSSTFEHAFADGKCTASAHWLNSVLTKQRMFPPKNALDFPTSFKWQLSGAEKYSMTLTNYMDEERALVKDMMKICGIPCTGHLDRNTTHLICKKPEGRKYEKAQEWGVQVVNSTFLADTIHNGQVPVVLFPRYTRLGTKDEFSPGHSYESAVLLRPWQQFMESYSRMNPELVDRDSTAFSLSFSLPSLLKPGALGKHQQESPLEQTSAKKLKLETGPEVLGKRTHQPVVLVTGISTAVALTLKSAVIKLGGSLTEQGSECTHIVVPSVTRTIKFLCGISVCRHIITPAWVDQSLLEGHFVNEERFRLVDKDAEQFFGMVLSESLARAQSAKMLQGINVFSTPCVLPPSPALKEIVRCAGGELLSLSEVRAKYGQELGDAVGKLLVISTPQEVAAGHCRDFYSSGLTVFSAEMLLTGILRQRLDFSTYKIAP